VALSRELNANLLRRWIVEHDAQLVLAKPQSVNFNKRATDDSPTEFIPAALSTGISRGEPIRIELCLGDTIMNVFWPLAAAMDCATWIT
jgi:transposase